MVTWLFVYWIIIFLIVINYYNSLAHHYVMPSYYGDQGCSVMQAQSWIPIKTAIPLKCACSTNTTVTWSWCTLWTSKMGNRPARIRNPDPYFLPHLPLDKKIPAYALKRRGAISGVPELQNSQQPIQRPRYKRRGGVCYHKTDTIAVYIRYLG